MPQAVYLEKVLEHWQKSPEEAAAKQKAEEEAIAKMKLEAEAAAI